MTQKPGPGLPLQSLARTSGSGPRGHPIGSAARGDPLRSVLCFVRAATLRVSGSTPARGSLRARTRRGAEGAPEGFVSAHRTPGREPAGSAGQRGGRHLAAIVPNCGFPGRRAKRHAAIRRAKLRCCPIDVGTSRCGTGLWPSVRLIRRNEAADAGSRRALVGSRGVRATGAAPSRQADRFDGHRRRSCVIGVERLPVIPPRGQHRVVNV